MEEHAASPCGAIRRAQALIARGFTPKDIKDAALRFSSLDRVSESEIVRIARMRTMTVGLQADAALRDAYAALEDHDPDPGTPADPVHDIAKHYGWIPPEEWVSGAIDDPFSFPVRIPDEVDFEIAFRAARSGDTERIRLALPDYEDRLRLAHRIMGLIEDESERNTVIGSIDANSSDERYRKKHASWVMEQVTGRVESGAWSETRGGPVVMIATGVQWVTTDYAPMLWRWMAEVFGSGDAGHVVFHGGRPGSEDLCGMLARTVFGVPVKAPAVNHAMPCRPPCERSGSGARGHRVIRSGVSRCPMATRYRDDDMVTEAVKMAAGAPGGPGRAILLLMVSRDPSLGIRHLVKRSLASGLQVKRRHVARCPAPDEESFPVNPEDDPWESRPAEGDLDSLALAVR